MWLSRMRLRGYRCMSDTELSLSRHSLLIGGNGTGKTSILEAIDKVFGAGRRGYGFREQDVATGAAKLIIDFELCPDDGQAFTREEHAMFETHVEFGDDGSEMVLIRVVAGREEDGVFRSRGTFTKSDDEPDGVLDNRTRTLIGFFYLPSARDARREFEDARGLWSRLAGLLETASDPERLEQLTVEAGRELVVAVLGEDRLNNLSETLEKFVAAMYGDPQIRAELRATAIDVRTLLREMSLVVGTPGDLLPLYQQSTGLQTLALFGLFRAYLETAAGYLLGAGLEEPEIHLAPHVARALVSLAREPQNQLVLTTHSPTIASTFSVRDIRVLRAGANGTSVHEVSSELFDQEEEARLHRELRTLGTEFLFARSVLLCEGESERGALPEFAAKMGVDLDSLGVSVLPVGGGGFLPFLKLLGPEGFDIPHAVVCDNDGTLRTLLRNLATLGLLPQCIERQSEVDANTLDVLSNQGYFVWPSGDLETYLVEQGGYACFEAAADFLYGQGHLASFRAGKLADGIDDDVRIIRQYVQRRGVRKPELAAECAMRFSMVPSEVAAIVRHLTSLAALEADADLREN